MVTMTFSSSLLSNTNTEKCIHKTEFHLKEYTFDMEKSEGNEAECKKNLAKTSWKINA